jgi:N-acetylneuraminate synthase
VQKIFELYTKENLAVKRAGKGVLPSLYWDMLGRKAEKTYKVDDSI